MMHRTALYESLSDKLDEDGHNNTPFVLPGPFSMHQAWSVKVSLMAWGDDVTRRDSAL